MCTQRQALVLCSWLSSLLVLIHDVNSKLLQARGWSSGSQGSLSTCLPTQTITLANEVGKKAIVDKGLGKKRGLYFIFIVASVAASSFVLFHAALSLELLEWRSVPCTLVRNSGIKNFSLPICFYENLTWTWKFARWLFSDLWYVPCWSVCNWDQVFWLVKGVLDCLIVPSQALDCLIFSGSKVKLQSDILDLLIVAVQRSPWSLDQFSKGGLIAGFNFDPGHKCFITGHINDHPCLQCGHKVGRMKLKSEPLWLPMVKTLTSY